MRERGIRVERAESPQPKRLRDAGTYEPGIQNPKDVPWRRRYVLIDRVGVRDYGEAKHRSGNTIEKHVQIVVRRSEKETE